MNKPNDAYPKEPQERLCFPRTTKVRLNPLLRPRSQSATISCSRRVLLSLLRSSRGFSSGRLRRCSATCRCLLGCRRGLLLHDSSSSASVCSYVAIAAGKARPGGPLLLGSGGSALAAPCACARLALAAPFLVKAEHAALERERVLGGRVVEFLIIHGFHGRAGVGAGIVGLGREHLERLVLA